jgi:putative phosphoribosyl transferase
MDQRIGDQRIGDQRSEQAIASGKTLYDSKERGTAVEIGTGNVAILGDLHIPASVNGAVLFAHGSGSSRMSPRNQFVARALEQSGMATLLLDLLTEEEEARERGGAELRFDIELLTGRLNDAVTWLAQHREMNSAKIGIFGASTGAAAGLAAAARNSAIATVVSRGGRPDLAGPALENVQVPVLLIVGGEDGSVVNLNRRALARLGGEKKLEIIAGATHLFEEPGTLERVAQLSRHWFEHFLGRSVAAARAA